MPKSKRHNKTHPRRYEVHFTPAESVMLKQLSKRSGVTRPEWLRQAVRGAHALVFGTKRA